jgi:hypothetical protein
MAARRAKRIVRHREALAQRRMTVASKVKPDPLSRAIAQVIRAIDVLIRLTAHDDENIRRGAGQTLYSLEQICLERLIKVAHTTEDPTIRIQIVKLLGAFGNTYPQAVMMVLDQLLRKHGDPAHMEACSMAAFTMRPGVEAFIRGRAVSGEPSTS